MKFSPDTTIIAFDLHGVLVSHDIRKMVALWWEYPKKFHFLLHLLRPDVLCRVLYLRYHGAVAEKILLDLTTRYSSLAHHKELGITILNAQQPIAKSLELVKTLRAQGYTIHLFSNIGEQLFKLLAHEYPWLYELFSVQVTTTAATNYRAKPNPRAFVRYVQNYTKPTNQIIFIDNNRRNIFQARTCGLTGILFKNPAQLKRELFTLLEG